MTARAPAAPLALFFVAGLLLPWPGALLPVALAAGLLGGVLVCAARGRLAAGTVLALLGYAALGGASRELRDAAGESRTLDALYRLRGEAHFAAPARIVGRLRDAPELSEESAALLVDVEEIRLRRERLFLSGGVRVTVRGDERGALAGLASRDRVALWARLWAPSGARNPGGLDAESYFARESVELLGSTKSALLVERLQPGSGLVSALSRARRRAAASLERELGGRGDALGVVTALVTGDRSRLAPALERKFQRAGVFHVMAISGAHVAILTLLVYGAARRAGMDEAPVLVGLLVLLPLYAGFCGGRPPVVRAATMASVVALARLASLDRPRANALALGALGLLAWNPDWLADPGFQLSFGAMASIFWLFDEARLALAPLGRLGPPLALSLSAQAGVVPLTAWHFLRLAPAAPIASLFAIPLAALVVVLGLGLALVAELPGLRDLSGPLALAAEAAVALLVACAELFARLPLASVDTGRPGVGWILLYVLSLAAMRACSRTSRSLSLLVALGLVLSLLPGSPNPPGELSLTALDVGHGDALVLRHPGGENVLVDGGGAPGSSFDVGAAVILPYLRFAGVRRLDAVVLTHTDFDHLGGLLTVVEELPVGEIWEGAPRFDRAPYRALRARAEARGVAFRRLRPGERFDYGGVRWEVLAAGGLPGLAPIEDNDRSVVVRLVYGRSSFLLTGDAERPVEEALLRGAPARLRADVLKVAHHGSRSSSTAPFLRAVSPRLAIVSGRQSSGRPLPSIEVLDRLRAHEIETWRTDESGAITVRATATGELRLSTFR